MSTVLHRTYQPGCFYTDFDKLPAAAQAALHAAADAGGEIECSAYTIWQRAGFVRADVEIDGQLYAAEISLGDLSPEEWRPEDDAENDENDDEYAEAILGELLACIDLEHQTVYLKEV
jgi:hypothetical protein